MPRYLVVIPTYNEAENLPDLVRDIFSLDLEEVGVLIVDDASPDGTGQVAERLAAQYPGRMDILHRKRKDGLGTAYLQGFRYGLDSDARIIIQMDADFSHPASQITQFLKLIETNDVVIGSRYVPGGTVYSNRAVTRRFLSWLSNSLMARLILGGRIKDATSGFRCWRSDALRAIGLERIRSKGYIFQVEMCRAAQKRGLRIVETPIYFGVRRCGKSKMCFDIQLEAVIWFFRQLFRPSD
ncbi:MAG: polyprenol monophosphomannose synthase [Desulfobacterales bacterium]|jgi:dolichol-phosphate mannosyltransferase